MRKCAQLRRRHGVGLQPETWSSQPRRNQYNIRAGWTAGRFELLGVITEWAWAGYVEFSGAHDTGAKSVSIRFGYVHSRLGATTQPHPGHDAAAAVTHGAILTRNCCKSPRLSHAPSWHNLLYIHPPPSNLSLSYSTHACPGDTTQSSSSTTVP